MNGNDFLVIMEAHAEEIVTAFNEEQPQHGLLIEDLDDVSDAFKDEWVSSYLQK